VPVPGPGLSGRVATGRVSGVKMGDDGGGLLISSDGVTPIRMVSVSASVIFPYTTKSRRNFLLVPTHVVVPEKKDGKTVL